MKPRIFISAVTKELMSARQLVANTLVALGYEPIWQEIFDTSGEDFRAMLRNKIDSCSAVLQIVGEAYGAEPRAPDEEFGRVSYTQYEALYARSIGKKVYYLIASNDLPRDVTPESIDLPRDSDADRADADRRRQLQRDYLASIQSTGHIYYPVHSNPETELAVRRLKDELDQLRRGFRNWMIGVSAGLLLIAFGIVWLGGGLHGLLTSVQEGQKKTVEQLAASGEKTTKELKGVIDSAIKELTNPSVLAERIRKEIQATAEAKINALPDEPGRGRKIAEIEKERDLASGRVEDLIKLIQAGLKEGASPIFQRAADILQKEGTDEALAYLESRRRSTLDTARLHADQAMASQAKADSEKDLRNKSLQPLILEAELLESKLRREPALKLREQIAELAPDWFDARNRLGLLQLDLVRYQEAEVNFRAALKLAATTAEEAIALNNLAQLLQDTNRRVEAEPLMRRALAIDEQSYGSEHPNVARDLNNLATLLQETNRRAEAEPLMRRALVIDEQFFGVEHPNVAIKLNNLALLLQANNRLVEAERLMRRALAIDEQTFGANDPRVGRDLNNLARLLHDTNRLMEAEPLLRRALTVNEQSYGAKHPTVAANLTNLALLLRDTNRLAEAEPLMRRALGIDEHSFEAAHPNVALDLNNLATLLQDTNRLVEAEPLLRRALDIFEKSYGADHPNVAVSLNTLSLLLKTTNRLAEAEPLMLRALAIDEQSYGPEHPNVAIRLNNFAQLLQDTNRLSGAEPLMRRALAIDEQSFGAEHPNVGRDLNNLAQLLKATNRLAEAEPLMRRALFIDEQSYGTEHPDVGRDLNNLAQLLRATNRLAEAEPLMRRNVIIVHRFGLRAGHSHPQMAAALLSYRMLLHASKYPQDKIDQRVDEAAETIGPLEPFTPEVERLLGPAKPVADVLASLDHQYKADGKPAAYFVAVDQPMVPHLDELLVPNAYSLAFAGISAFNRRAYADAIALYDESLSLHEDNPESQQLNFKTRMNRSAALRELGEVVQARDELRLLLAESDNVPTTPALTKGRLRYHLALCEWRLGDHVSAKRMAEESIQEYGSDPEFAWLASQTEKVLVDLQNDKPPPRLPTLDSKVELDLARARYHARIAFGSLSLKESALPLLDQILGPAETTQQVFEKLDQQYRQQNKPRVWFLSLSEPIAPHLDQLLGPVKPPDPSSKTNL